MEAGKHRIRERLIERWMPDVRAQSFKVESHRQSLAVATSAQAAKDQAFINSVSEHDKPRREDIWTVAGGEASADKPRLVLVVQDDNFDATESITVFAFTADETEAPQLRLLIEPNEGNGLRTASRIMVDKMTTVSKRKLGVRVGKLDKADSKRLDERMIVFLGLTVSS